MKNTLYLALGFWLAHYLFRRRTLVVDPVMDLRNAGF